MMTLDTGLREQITLVSEIGVPCTTNIHSQLLCDSDSGPYDSHTFSGVCPIATLLRKDEEGHDAYQFYSTSLRIIKNF